MDHTNLSINKLRLRQNGHHIANDIFKCIFMNENVRILIEFSLKFVPVGLITNIPALGLIMAWRWPGNNPLSESMMVRLPTHICVTRPQWVNDSRATSKQIKTHLHIWDILHVIHKLWPLLFQYNNKISIIQSLDFLSMTGCQCLMSRHQEFATALDGKESNKYIQKL